MAPRDSPHTIAQFQRAWNALNRTRALHYPALHVDGVRGHNTKIAMQKARYYLGLGTGRWDRNPVEVSDAFTHLLAHPFAGNIRRRRLATKRCKARVARWKASRRPPAPAKGLLWMDGRRGAAWIVRGLTRVRAHGVAFAIFSLWRSAAYSTSLCIRICGRPTCPGVCAGASTNHTGIEFPHGAADTGNAGAVRAEAQRLGIPLHNHLPRDFPHSSYNGY